MVREMADEAVARDVWKSARSAAIHEKSSVVQASALQVGTDPFIVGLELQIAN